VSDVGVSMQYWSLTENTLGKRPFTSSYHPYGCIEEMMQAAAAAAAAGVPPC
jgi:hypothetical protein